MKLTVPELSLVVLMGPSGSGKSRFAERHFRPSEVLSSDRCRGLVSDDENDQSATQDAFELLHFIAAKRLSAGRLTVVDATNVQVEARRPLLALARQHDCIAVAVVLDLPEKLCVERNASRPDRRFGRRVVAQQRNQLRRSIRGLRREGFRYVYVLRSEEDVNAVQIERSRLWTDRRDEGGPFDIIGDIHGCADELEHLLARLGYERRDGWGYAHAAGRRPIFLGDVVDRGPRILDAYRIVRDTVDRGGLCVPGNHDVKLVRKLRGRDVQITHGLERTLAELEALPEEERTPLESEMADFFDSLVSHFVLDGGRLVVAHAGMKRELQGRASGRVREFALYGETTGETDEFGLPVRHDWASEYRGSAMVVYGHTPTPEPAWLNRTIDIDTGCVFGGRLSALRYPELEIVSVDARATYCAPVRPLGVSGAVRTLQQEQDALLDMEDVRGKRIIDTRLRPAITVREENAAAALEAMSRFAVDPRWLVYLPPTMSPSATTGRGGLLEHPDEALDYFHKRGVKEVVCQEKHMGSRAVVVVCRDPDAARRRFGVTEDEAAPGGICYTRTGRRFFEDRALEARLLAQVRSAVGAAGLWDELETSWLCLDCELMPWSAKAQALLEQQYAAVGAAGAAALDEALGELETAHARGADVGALVERTRRRRERVVRYREAYARYCWPVRDVADLRLAPFHLLASEGAVHADRSHRWHMELLERLSTPQTPLLLPTEYRCVDPADLGGRRELVDWWEELTARGGEGIVVKPLDFVARGRHGPLQPALKCRGREYLRIIYGPEYTAPENLERLRERGLSRKRSLAIRQLALGLEALERFVGREPLRRVHECVFAILALEAEPVDPRL